MSNFAPTSEQQACIDAFATGEDMVIEAGAGTGKTSTLRLLAESTDRRGLFLAFNKSNRMDAKECFPGNVDCHTGHSYSRAKMFKIPGGAALMGKMNRGPKYLPSKKVVEILGIPSKYQIGEIEVPAWVIASAVTGTIRRFCQGGDTEITEYHVPRQRGLEDAHNEIQEIVLPFAEKAWNDILDSRGRLVFSFDHYLKIWALTAPTIDVDFIMLDEAQDTNGVLAKVFNAQKCQKIVVGDRCQAIYEWRGAKDALSVFPATHRLLLSQSFRFGDAVAQEANRFLALLDSPLKLNGFDQIESALQPVENPSAIICRTNATVIQHAMDHQAKGRKVAIVGGTKEIESFAEVARDLMNGKRPKGAEFAHFGNWAQLVQYSQTDDGAEFRVMVKLVENYGVDAILEVCHNSVDERGSDLIVTTAHKAKGREWARVLIANDFRPSEDSESDTLPSIPELKLMYVAVTRAKEILDCAALSWVNAQPVA